MSVPSIRLKRLKNGLESLSIVNSVISEDQYSFADIIMVSLGLFCALSTGLSSTTGDVFQLFSPV